MQWVVDNGGYVSPKLELRAFVVEIEGMDDDSDDEDNDKEKDNDEDDDDDERYSFSIFVKDNESIKEGEELIRFPDRIMIYSNLLANNDLDNT
eukprot:6815376-Ditylum_brightwellii.AAC.1